jgi:hypothetical protein
MHELHGSPSSRHGSAVRSVSENLDHDVSNGAIDSVLEKLVAIQDGNEVGDF